MRMSDSCTALDVHKRERRGVQSVEKFVTRVLSVFFASMTERSGGSTSFLRSLPLETGDLPNRSYDHFDTLPPRQRWSTR